ncbi:MAG: hypothetical protein ACLUHA_15195 [Bacteroides stercoris]
MKEKNEAASSSRAAFFQQARLSFLWQEIPALCVRGRRMGMQNNIPAVA